jgi:hypothetical protein
VIKLALFWGEHQPGDKLALDEQTERQLVAAGYAQPVKSAPPKSKAHRAAKRRSK